MAKKPKPLPPAKPSELDIQVGPNRPEPGSRLKGGKPPKKGGR